MWNDQKFFEDFKKESEKIKPDAAFVSQLKELTTNGGVKRKNNKVVIYRVSAVAALVAICIIVASALVVIKKPTETKDNDKENITVGLQAGDDDAVIDEEKDELQKVIDDINSGRCDVCDVDGNPIDSEEKNEFVTKLNKAVIDKNTTGLLGTYEEYICGETDVRIYFNKYIVINGQIFSFEE